MEQNLIVLGTSYQSILPYRSVIWNYGGRVNL